MTAPAGPDNTSRASAWGDGASRGWTLSLAASGPTVCLVRANEEVNIVVAPATPATSASASALALPAALSGGSPEPAAGGRSTSACRTSKTVTMRFLRHADDPPEHLLELGHRRGRGLARGPLGFRAVTGRIVPRHVRPSVRAAASMPRSVTEGSVRDPRFRWSGPDLQCRREVRRP